MGPEDLYRALMGLYRKEVRRKGWTWWWPGKTRDEIIISAVLTQNTSWRNVEKAMGNLGGATLERIREMPIRELERRIRPAGFFRQKARTLKALACLKDEPTREELLGIKGIGKETADAILLYAFRKPEFVVDAYTKRMAKRIWGIEMGYEGLKRFFSEPFKRRRVEVFSKFHGLIVEHSKEVCRKFPECWRCPISWCKSFNGKGE